MNLYQESTNTGMFVLKNRMQRKTGLIAPIRIRILPRISVGGISMVSVVQW